MDASGADDGTRTRNLLFTKQLLCQLSYVGKPDTAKSCAIGEYTEGLPVESTVFGASFSTLFAISAKPGQTGQFLARKHSSLCQPN